jgi:hypothetical protein
MKVTKCTCPKCLNKFDENVALQDEYPCEFWTMSCRLCGTYKAKASAWDEIYKDVPKLNFTPDPPPAAYLKIVYHHYKRRA